MIARTSRRVFVVTLGCLWAVYAMSAHAGNHAIANTADVQGGPFSGQNIPGLLVMNTPCAFGDNYHFQIDDAGTLRVLGSLSCRGSGGKEICHLGPDFSCRGITDFSTAGTTTYAVNETGVVVGGKMFPWLDPSQATAMFASVNARADSRCNQVLARQAKRTERGKPANDKELADQEACKPLLSQLCTASNGGEVHLSNGKEITVLCQ